MDVAVAFAPTVLTPTYVGIVKSFNPDKGWGHIQCDSTHQLYGKDIFMLRSHLPDVGIAKGAKVTFNVMQGNKGPEATNIQVVPNAEGRYVGAVKSWNAVKGWGHISCEVTHRLFGKDMFVMRSSLVGGMARSGDAVSFTVVMGNKGPEAADVQLLSPTQPQQLVPHPQQLQNFGPYELAALASSGCCEGGQFFGVVKAFNEEKGWGHILCDATKQLFGKDMFLLRSALQGQAVQAGDQVAFAVASGSQGPEATNVMVFSRAGFGTEGAAARLQPEGAGFTGAIKSFNVERGYGFIACEDARAIFGKDIFVRNKELGGVLPNPGDELQFKVTMGSDGRPEATSVTLQATGAAGADLAAMGAYVQQGLAAAEGAYSACARAAASPRQREGPY